MRLIVAAVISFTGLIPFSSPVRAEVSRGIIATPSIIRLDLGRDEAQAEVYYKNNTPSPVEINFLAQDFSPEEETGRIRFLLPPDAQNYQYSLASWITFERQSITLSANEGQSVRIFINKEKLTAGGHYASLQARLSQSPKEGQVPIEAILATLIFVRAGGGGEREAMSLQSVFPNRTFLGFPDSFSLRLRNAGNVEIVPWGLIEIKDLWGRVVAKGIVNEGSLLTLPESVRRFDVPLKRLDNFLFPGLYRAETYIHFGSEDKSFHQRTDFISAGSLNLWLAGLIFGAAVLLWRRGGLNFKIGPRP